MLRDQTSESLPLADRIIKFLSPTNQDIVPSFVVPDFRNQI